MVIKGTDRIKGVLDLSSVGLQLKKGSTFSISDNDYWNSDVQASIKMGFLVSAGDPSKKSSADSAKIVRCVNSFHRPLTLSGKEIMPNHSFTLPESRLVDPDIKVAINRGMITVTQVVDTGDYSEGFLELGNLFSKEASKKKAKKESEANVFKKQINKAKQELKDQKDDLETNEEISSLGEVVEPEIVWNPSSKSPSLKNAVRTTTEDEGNNAELVTPNSTKDKIISPSNIIDDPNPEPVQVEDIKRSTVVVNPHGKNIINPIKDAEAYDPTKDTNLPDNIINSESPEPVQAPELSDKATVISPGQTKTAKKTGAWNPTGEPEIKTFRNNKNEDLIFADKEQEKQRLASHPKLKDKQIVVEENDPIAPDSIAKNRIATHPVLSKKTDQEQNQEIDFVG